MHLHGAIAKQAVLTPAGPLPPLKRGGGTLAQQASDEAAQAAKVKPNGLYFTLKSAVGRKSSDDTDDESSPGDSSPSSPEADAAATTVEAESASSPGAAGLPAMTGQLYTARGALAAAPPVAGGVFEATV